MKLLLRLTETSMYSRSGSGGGSIFLPFLPFLPSFTNYLIKQIK